MFKRIDHVVISTEDIQEAARLWQDNLGLKVAESFQPPQAGFQVARLPVGDAFLELVQPLAETGRFAEQFREQGEGLFSISIEVKDLEGAIAYLRERGAQVSDPEAGIWPDTRVARVSAQSSHGVSIQLIQRIGQG